MPTTQGSSPRWRSPRRAPTSSCLQEIDNLEALKAFEYGYLFKMVGQGYRNKYTSTGNDSRGIDVAVMMRDETAHGQKIDFVRMTSHAAVTFEEFGLHTPELEGLGHPGNERIFRRDCLEIDVTSAAVRSPSIPSISNRWGRRATACRDATPRCRCASPRRSAVRRIIEDRFGKDHASDKSWVICGDFNDYRQRVAIEGDQHSGYTLRGRSPSRVSSLDVLLADGFAENVVERRPELDRWTLYHSRGPQERHLCQLDYILLSAALSRAQCQGGARHRARRDSRGGRSSRPARRSSAIPRAGWDRPKASDHCPVAVTLDIG